MATMEMDCNKCFQVFLLYFGEIAKKKKRRSTVWSSSEKSLNILLLVL